MSLFRMMNSSQSIDHIMRIVYVPLETGLGVDLLLGLCLVDVDFVLSSMLPEQLSFIHLCIRTTHTQKKKNQHTFNFTILFYFVHTGF